MKFCQARLSPPLIGQIAAEASLDAGEDYLRERYTFRDYEYPENAFFNAGTIEDVKKKAEQMEQNA